MRQKGADTSFLPVIAVGIAAVGVILIASVVLTGGLVKGYLSVCIGVALLAVAAGFGAASRRRR